MKKVYVPLKKTKGRGKRKETKGKGREKRKIEDARLVKNRELQE